ncbi:S66 peptidase family protein [Glycomyces algeriensis]|uniref:Peptidase S66 n=1 Tax=Glycomyces algeriensis TaxID=256037 RepID=A0A9W6GDL9_9ACTN|nr:LD-carboxypeptidase [Glycomyces algeriensis]MDA1366423.1 LD-carboxypeptidase [Glycomyces algeriensis]MDR7352082.1 muramoyltetrapeptide carboxypeptidase [Glycomyces algeriensis]GLI44814.1 peptidase S66 [Glycomyces algeriensis]
MRNDPRPSLSRRALIGAVAAGAVAATAQAAPAAAAKARKPAKLEAGDLVVVPAPGGPTTAAAVAKGIAILEGWGLRVELTEHALDTYGWLSAPDEHRLADLQYALDHSEAKAVMTARGGYGTTRIIDEVSFKGLKKHPKLIVGYSDITALHLAARHHTGLASLHSPMMAWSSNNTAATAESLRTALMTTDPVVLTRDPLEPTSAVLVPGTASGPLYGGNLSLLDAEPDESHLPDADGAILFIEDTDEARYRIDGMLTRYLRAGHLDGLAGIAVGQFTPDEHDEYKPGEWTMSEVLMNRLGGLGIPVLGGVKVGHGLDPRVMPLGTQAVLDADAGTLTIEAAVAD